MIKDPAERQWWVAADLIEDPEEWLEDPGAVYVVGDWTKPISVYDSVATQPGV